MNNFCDVVRKYCLIEGEEFIIKNKSQDMHDVIKNFNDYIKNNLFNFTLATEYCQDYVNTPTVFIVEWTELHFIIIRKENGKLINLSTTDLVTHEKLINKKIFFISKKIKTLDSNEIYKTIKKMTPKSGYFSLGLIVFSLMTPLYSNLFNTRLVYSDSYHSVFFVTGIFVIFIVLELALKNIIHAKNLQQIKTNNLNCNSLYLQILKISNCRGGAVKIRTIDTSVVALWESYPLISVDVSLAILFLMCLFLIMGGYALPLFIYYIIFSFICVHIRFSAYKKTIQTNTASYEKMTTLISLEENRKELRFFKDVFFENLLMDKANKDEYIKMEMNVDNHHWSEIIKANSFISMIVMFMSSYFAVAAGAFTIASIIAVMIINSRLSGSIVSAINRTYTSKLNEFQIKNSLTGLLKDCDSHITHNGITPPIIEKFSVENLTISLHNRLLIENLSFSAKPGDMIGIIGSSGCGKTSLIRVLANIKNNYTGAIKLNDVNIEHISNSYTQNCIAYHSAESSFIKGTIRDNFTIHGVLNENDIIKILNLCCKNLELSKENIDEKYADELNLSNGEKQKILLCLSLYKKPQIVFMDESTSFLPPSDAIFFLNKIKKLYSNAIVIFATHDTSLTKLFTQTIDLSSSKLNVKRDNVINIPYIKL